MEGEGDIMLVECSLNEAIIDLLEEDLISNLNIFGILENSKNIKIYVDDLSFPTGVVVNDGYFNYVYTKNDDFIEEIIKHISKEKGEYGFSGVKSDIAEKIKSRFELEWENPCTLYYYDKKAVECKNIKSNVCSVKIEDADVVDEYYTYRDESTIQSIKDSISNRMSRCVYKDGELASWLLTHKDNSLGPIFTREEYRKEGYAIDVTLSLIDELVKAGKIPYFQVVKGNFASDKLAKKCGFKPHGSCQWFGVTVSR